MKKCKKMLVSALCLAIGVGGVAALTACGDGGDKGGDGKLTVTFYDATGTNDPKAMKVVKTVKVDKNGKIAVGEDGTVDGYKPEKEGGYEFVDWFATPSKSHAFDFDEAITKNVSIYGGFTKYKEDTREYYVVGSGKSKLLLSSNWGKNITAEHKLTKTAGKNEYKITMDVKENDEFQFAIDTAWANQRGFGYMARLEEDGEEYFTGQGSVYADSSKKTNIKCVKPGNYTFTLTTYPGDDWYDTTNEHYTEAGKETFNMGTYDKINWVRNGDVVDNVTTVTEMFIKGNMITGWDNMYNVDTLMKQDGDTYTLEVFLKQNDEFMFASRIAKIGDDKTEYSDGAEVIKSDILDDAAKEYLEALSWGNMKAKANGTYTFTYNIKTKKLTVAFDATKIPAAMDYYVAGTAVTDKWDGFNAASADYKLTETAEGSGVYAITVALKADNEFQIRTCEAGTQNATLSNTKERYQYDHMMPSKAFEAMSAANRNIKVKKAGTYKITFDSYSKRLTVVKEGGGYDIYIKGSMQQGWNHGFADEYRFVKGATEGTYELTIEIDKDTEFGFAKYDEDIIAGNGTFIGKSNVGTAGDANADFDLTGSNIKASKDGTYKIVYTVATDKIDFYNAEA